MFISHISVILEEPEMGSQGGVEEMTRREKITKTKLLSLGVGLVVIRRDGF